MSVAIPTAGVARRRAKAVARREACDEARFYLDGRVPRHAIAVDVCLCGRVSWLSRHAADGERDGFRRDSDDHAAYCDGGAV